MPPHEVLVHRGRSMGARWAVQRPSADRARSSRCATGGRPSPRRRPARFAAPVAADRRRGRRSGAADLPRRDRAARTPSASRPGSTSGARVSGRWARSGSGTCRRHRSREPRAGNPQPGIARYPPRGAMVNAMGLPNPGAEAAAEALRGAARDRTAVRQPSPTRPSPTPSRAVRAARAARRRDRAQRELPNVSWGRDRDTEAHLARAAAAPSPSSRRCRSSSSSALRRRAVERDVDPGPRRLAAGPARRHHLREHAPVATRRKSSRAWRALRPGPVGGRTPRIVGGGPRGHRPAGPRLRRGLHADDARACLEAGATTVQIYTALIYEGRGWSGSSAARLLAPRFAPAHGPAGPRPDAVVAALPLCGQDERVHGPGGGPTRG